jgi:hypothetical protein
MSLEEDIISRRELFDQLEQDVLTGDESPDSIVTIRKIQDILQQQIKMLIRQQTPVNTCD